MSDTGFGLSRIPEENVYGSLLFKVLAPAWHNSYYLLNENQAVVNAPLLWRSEALGNWGQAHSFSEHEGSISPPPSPPDAYTTGWKPVSCPVNPYTFSFWWGQPEILRLFYFEISKLRPRSWYVALLQGTGTWNTSVVMLVSILHNQIHFCPFSALFHYLIPRKNHPLSCAPASCSPGSTMSSRRTVPLGLNVAGFKFLAGVQGRFLIFPGNVVAFLNWMFICQLSH